MARLDQERRRPCSRLLLGPGRSPGRSPGPLAPRDRPFTLAGGGPGLPYQGPGPLPDPFSRGYFLDRYVY